MNHPLPRSSLPLKVAIWTVCPDCHLIHDGTRCVCGLLVEENPLPHWPLLVLLTLAGGVLLGGGVGLLWLLWGVAR
jgi:hypothetical protein